MGGRPGRGKGTVARPQRVSAETEERLRNSDARYLLESRQRMRHHSTRTWIIRLAVVVAVLAVIRLWGIDFLNSTLFGAKTTAFHAEEGRDAVQAGTDRRTGANFDPNP
jgi:hypothetical protein